MYITLLNLGFMYTNERFIVGHMRMLLVSRFIYKKVEEIVQVQSAKVVILVRPELYDLAATMLFFMSDRWPTSRKYTRRVRGLREGYSVVAVATYMDSGRFSEVGYSFFWKCQTVYFPLLDSTDAQIAHLFKVHSSPYHNQTTYNMPAIVDAVPELDYIAEGSFGAIRSFATSSVVRLFMLTSTTKRAYTRNEHINVVRSFSIPAFFPAGFKKEL